MKKKSEYPLGHFSDLSNLFEHVCIDFYGADWSNHYLM